MDKGLEQRCVDYYYLLFCYFICFGSWYMEERVTP